MNRSAVFLFVPLLAACNVQSRNPSSSDESVSINADETGQVAFNLPFAKGQVKLPASVMHGGNVDIDGVKLMPGSSLTGFKLNAGDHGSTVDMSFAAPASPDETRAYFLNQFRQKGVEAAAAGDTITGKSKDGSPFVIRVGPAQTGSQGRIIINARD